MLTKLSSAPKNLLLRGACCSSRCLSCFPSTTWSSFRIKLPRDIYRDPSLLPLRPTLNSYVQLFEQWEFLTNIRNSFVVAVLSTVFSVFISSMAAYSLVRLKYRGRNWMGRLILFSYLTPSSLLFIPLAVIINRLQLGNTLHGLVFVYLTFAAPLSTWLLMGFSARFLLTWKSRRWWMGPPACKPCFASSCRIIAPGLVAVSVFTFTGAWNELLLALIFTTSPEIRTIPVALQYLITGDVFRWNLIMAGSVVAAMPVMVLYYFSQRFVVQGLGAGAVKT